MMKYRVVYTERFLDDIEAHVDYLLNQRVAAHVVADWFDRLFDHLDSLNEWPKRQPVDELQTNRTGRETRRINFGDYLAFFQVDEASQQVNIIAFMHGASRHTPT